MPGQIRLGDMSVGHPKPGPTPSVSGSPNHFVNGKPVIRVGDNWASHGGHPVKSAQGSPNTFSGGLPRVREGDSLSCGDHAAKGSSNCIVN